MSTRGGAEPVCVAASTTTPAATNRRTTRGVQLRSRLFVPGTVLDRWRKPDPLVVLLQHFLSRDFVPHAHLGVLGFGRACVVPAVEVRRGHQASDRRAAARTAGGRAIVDT